jgi:hypothetical protein
MGMFQKIVESLQGKLEGFDRPKALGTELVFPHPSILPSRRIELVEIFHSNLKYAPISHFFLTLLLCGHLISFHHADAAFERPPLVPPIMARGGASVGWPEEPSALLWNPAGKISSHASFSTAYSRPYSVDDLDEGILNYGHTVAKRGGLGLSWQRFRTAGYYEERQAIAASYGHQSVRAGVRLDRFRIGIDGFGNRSALGVNVGGLWQINEDLQLGIAADALNRPQIPHPLPRRFVVGIGLRVRPGLLLVMDVRKETDVNVQILAGGELSVGHHLMLRAGMHNQPWEVTAGWGLRIRALVVDYAWVNHARLDGTHQIALRWDFGRR